MSISQEPRFSPEKSDHPDEYPFLKEFVRHVVEEGSSSPSPRTLGNVDKEGHRYSKEESGMVRRLIELFQPIQSLVTACKGKIPPEGMEKIKENLQSAIYAHITLKPEDTDKAALIGPIENAAEAITASPNEQSARAAFESFIQSVRPVS